MNRGNNRQFFIMLAFCIIPVVWAALLAAPAVSGGLLEILQNLTQALDNPFQITWHEDSLKTVLIFIVIYGIGIGIYLSTRRNTRPKEEHGSAKWGDPATVNSRYADKMFSENKIMTQNVRLGHNTHKHRRNLNTLVVGGSGSGKTRFYAKPNAMQANTSMIILDPKGEIARDTGHLLK